MPAYDLSFFENLKSSTKGMMPADVYYEFYKLSRNRSHHDIIDIGVGRGATTISFALGIQEGGRATKVHALDQFFQRKRGPHLYSMETNPHDCVELNVNEFRQNLERHNVSHFVETWVGDVGAIAREFPDTVRADVLSIDAAGHIDEFFPYFYDLVEPDGIIILDDCLDIVDRNAREAIKQMQTKSAEKILAHLDGLDLKKARLLLGKHKLTFYLASFFEEIGAIKPEKLLGKQTMVFRKSYSGTFKDFDLSRIKDIEKRIVEEYLAACIR
jgi:predicted O-methyltransferase YrrM